MRKTIVFGNGIGMALAPDAYFLPAVMNEVWEHPSLDDAQRGLIVACLAEGTVRPTREEELETLQNVVTACETLVGVPGASRDHWLSEAGRHFPDAVHRLSFLAARQMYLAAYRTGPEKGKPCELPPDFTAALVDMVKRTSSHVSTLNYDGLLSKPFAAAGLLGTSDGLLLDGFNEGRFDRNNLFRKRGLGSWYLHLHGCPLFADREKTKPYKLTEKYLSYPKASLKNLGRHLVLTHHIHKLNKIQSSPILQTYWEFLERAFEESDEIILFGYSGNDLHLNRQVAQQRVSKSVRVVEWLGAGTKAFRKKFWADQLGGEVALNLMEDVLSFTDW